LSFILASPVSSYGYHSRADEVPVVQFLKRWQPHAYGENDALLRFGCAGRDTLPRTIRCLVWNMYKAKRRYWSTDFQHLSADRDLILLQEAVANAPTDPVFYESTHHNWLMARSHRHPSTGVTTGVKTGSVARAIDAQSYLSPHREPLLQTQKAMLATRYEVAHLAQSLLVLNLHAVNFVTVAKFQAHIQQVANALAQHAGPTLVAGDFNTWRRARQLSFESMANELGLRQAQWGRRKQWQHMRQHLDHVYFRDMQPVYVESLDFIRSSDHKPISVTFRL